MSVIFGNALRKCRVRAGLQQAELAKAVQVTPSYISLLESGKRLPPSDEITTSIERALGVREGELVKLAHLERTPADIRAEIEEIHEHKRLLEAEVIPGELGRVPLINKVAAGYPAEFTDKGYPVGFADEYITVPDLDDPNAFAISVVGDSMEPRFKEGDILIISPGAGVNNGDVCFVRIDHNGDTRSTIKQVWFDENGIIRLVSLNTKYPPQVMDRERVGGVFRAIRRLEKL